MATIFPANPTVGDTYQGYEWNGTAWVIIGVDLTTDYVTQLEFDGLIDSAPESLDTLNELAAALDDDANFATTVTNALATKASTTYVDNALSSFETLPDQTNNAGKFLTTDGSNASWGSPSAGNLDGGVSNSIYGGTTSIDGGGVS